ncbi:MAG TPA: T9SS type A sorting domain-containing protein, partial [Bacteroidia bacterium]|nr:T9SS type A sorting domain-containing protein [Bacteroidia bacterium]
MTIRNYAFLLGFILNHHAFSQSRIVWNNDAYVVLSNSAYLVVDNSNSNAISLQGTGGNLISELETNCIKWNISTSTGSYTIPFTKSSGNKIPLTVAITGAGVGSGNILFSTYGGATWNNNTYKPSDVMNMTSSCCANNSAFVIDRFWKIDAVGYTSKPSGTLTFTYLDAEHTATGNTITESNLRAQRFNTTLASWDISPQGSINTSTNKVTSVAITSSNFFRSWTLTDNVSPLPIELVSFTVNCDQDNRNLNWITASESNNDYFTIERSTDGLSWVTLSIIKGAGSSTMPIEYSSTDPEWKQGECYYRLKQTDFDGHYTYSAIIPSDCSSPCIQDIKILKDPSNNPQVTFISTCSGNVDFYIYNSLGQLLFKQRAIIDVGENNIPFRFNTLSAGLYILKAAFGSSSFQEKFEK